MRDWRRTGLVIVLVGLVALGALAAQGWFGNPGQACVSASERTYATTADGQVCQQTEQSCQQLCGATCPGGMRGVRAMRCGR